MYKNYFEKISLEMYMMSAISKVKYANAALVC